MNVTLDDVEPLAKALAEHLAVDEGKTVETVIKPTVESTESAEESEQAEETAQVIESDLQMFDVLEANNVGASDQEAKKTRNATTEPLYNPMLDLINHDFG